MSWLYYLLEANLYLIIFYGFYRAFLHKETFYAINRYYLLLTSLTAFLLPLIQIGSFSVELTHSTSIIYESIEREGSLLNLQNISLTIYGLISFALLLRILWGFRYLLKLLKKSTKKIENGVRFIELTESKTAFSFFSLLFIDPEIPQKNTVLKHEMVHINQKHSLDVLFFELIQISSWFNPITYFLKADVKLIHEYLADEETTKLDIEKYDYALFLIQNSYGGQSITLTNQIFNSSILKRRISMLNQKKSAKWARLRLLLVLPIAVGMLCASTMAFTKDYGVIDLYPKNNVGYLAPPQDTLKKKKIKEVEILPAPPAPGQKSKVKGVKQAQVDQVKFPPPPIEPSTRKVKKTAQVDQVKFPPPSPKPRKRIESVEVEVVKPNLKEKTVQGYQTPPPPPMEPKTKVKGVEVKALKSKSDLKPVVVKGYPTPPPPPVEPAPGKKSNN